MGVIVSAAGLWDAEALSDVAATTFPLACPPGAAAESVGRFIEQSLSVDSFGDYLSDPAHRVLKATDGGAIVGYTMTVNATPADAAVAALLTARPALEISKMYVLPGHQGTGVSTALMHAAIAAARDARFAGVWLGVNQQNERAQRFYAKHGFITVGTRQFQVGGQTFSDYVMQLRLTASGAAEH